MDLRAAHPQAEPIQLVHYSVGQKYDAHYDWSVREPSTRFATLLLYLNEPQVLWQSSRGAREALRGVARRCEAWLSLIHQRPTRGLIVVTSHRESFRVMAVSGT